MFYEYITDIIGNRGLPLDHHSMMRVANELQQLHSPAYIVEQPMTNASDLMDHGAAGESGWGKISSAIVEIIRTVGEVERLRASGGDLDL